MRLVADEGVDKQIVERLRRDGHNVVYIAELDPGVDDKLVLQTASDSGALLLTADKDLVSWFSGSNGPIAVSFSSVWRDCLRSGRPRSSRPVLRITVRR